MGHNDHFEDDRPGLPEKAGDYGRLGFEPNEEWLRAAEPELQHEALRCWFLSRYWDPANDTPYMSSEGGYLYIHGGPYHADEELYGRFEGLVDEELIRDVIDDIESDGLYDWAPIHTEPDYDLEFELEISARDVPYRTFRDRIYEIESLANSELSEPQMRLLRQLLYSHLIGALEAYLAESMSYWLAEDDEVFRRFVGSCKEFKEKKLSVSDIFDRLDTLREEVDKYIHSVVWHRLDLVVPLFCGALRIKRPEIGALMKHVVMRHDIVHRGGRSKEGEIVNIDAEKLNELQGDVVEFADEIEESISRRFPDQNL